ncbi:MAG: pirin family protein [Hellea sp.]|nr:pirin family protein [Hellea sp.]
MTKISSDIKAVLSPKAKSLGDGITVKRALPFAGLRSVGPWVFFDHFGPVDFSPGQGMNVRPHPHINLATVTYLFEGEIFHRDSLGNALVIRPGAVNLMVAGNGIVHSERTSAELKATGYSLHGLQLWHALPESKEEIDAEFHHYPASEIPEFSVDGVKIRLIMGKAFGYESPVKTFCQTLYMEATLKVGQSLTLPDIPEMAVYSLNAGLMIDDQPIDENQFAVVNSQARVSSNSACKIAVIGGESLGHRFMEWNFISSRKDRIEQAKSDWIAGKFPIVPGDEEEFIPYP